MNAEVLPSHKRNQILAYQEGKKKVILIMHTGIEFNYIYREIFIPKVW